MALPQLMGPVPATPGVRTTPRQTAECGPQAPPPVTAKVGAAKARPLNAATTSGGGGKRRRCGACAGCVAVDCGACSSSNPNPNPDRNPNPNPNPTQAPAAAA
eukprot:scaffold15319_cov52-Phaeocystis_antarctica.AAC.2